MTKDLTEGEGMVFGVKKLDYESFRCICKQRYINFKLKKMTAAVNYSLQKVIFINQTGGDTRVEINSPQITLYKTAGYFQIGCGDDKAAIFRVTKGNTIIRCDENSFVYGWKIKQVSQEEVEVFPANAGDLAAITTLLMEMKFNLNKQGSDSTPHSSSDSEGEERLPGGGRGDGPKEPPTQVVPPSTSRPQPTASIRPMSMLGKATVTPAPSPPQQQQQQHQQQPVQGSSSTLLVSASVTPAPVSQVQFTTSTPDQSGELHAHHPPQIMVTVTSSAPTGTDVTTSTNVRQATVQPTQPVPLIPITTPERSAPAPGASASGGPQAPRTESTASTSGHGQQLEPPSTSTSLLDSEMSDSSEQVSSYKPSNYQPVLPVAPIRSAQEVEESSSVQPAASSQEVDGGAPVGPEEPSPSASTSRPFQASKRSREDEVETSEEAPAQEEPDSKSKRTRFAPQSRGHAQEHPGRAEMGLGRTRKMMSHKSHIPEGPEHSRRAIKWKKRMTRTRTSL